MVSTNDVRPGMTLNLPEGLFQVVHHEHVKPGKGKAFVRLKLKNVDSGAVLDRTFRAGENVRQAVIERKNFQFLYRDDLGFHFMDNQTYEQISVREDVIDEAAGYITDGMTVQLAVYEGQPIGIELSASAEVEVSHTEPAVKGDRVSGATKPVTLVTGKVIQAPLFVEIGDVVKVDTRTGNYITRVS